MSAKQRNRRLARWYLYLFIFDFKLHHRPGKRSLKPDALSRRPDHGKGEKDNEDIILIKPESLYIKSLQQGHILLEGGEKRILKRIRNSKSYDESVVKAVEELRKSP